MLAIALACRPSLLIADENQVRIGPSAAYLGYQEVRQPGRPVIAQVRMAGIIAEFAPRAPLMMIAVIRAEVLTDRSVSV
jgi:hypothetical protein